MYRNPVLRGFYPDPSVVRVGSDYYMVNSTFQYFPGIAISHSKDLVHWELIGHALTDPDDPDLSDIRDSHGIWAPDISYSGGRYIIMATLRLNGDGRRGTPVLRRQLVVSSDRPEGPYTRPAKLEVDSIDPSHFVDVDGRHYLVISPGVRILPLSDDCTRVTGEAVTVWEGTGERCPEGPHLFRRGKYYYAVLAEGGTGYGHGINVARSEHLTGPYEPSPYNPVLRQTDPEAPIQRTGHGKLVETQNGEWWAVYLLGRPNSGRYTTVGRETGLDPVTWTEDGWFLINDGHGPSTLQPSPDLPVQIWPRWLRDDFDAETLDPHWQFVRRPHPADITLTERPGFLRIYTGDGVLSEIRAANTVLRREEELCYTAETALEFAPSADGEQAGLVCYYSTATYLRCALCMEGGRRIRLAANRGFGEEVLAETDVLPEGRVWLRVETDHLRRMFSYSLDGTRFLPVGCAENCIYLCDEGVPEDPKRHTGTLVGIYCNNGGRGSRIPADFDYFSYSDRRDEEEREG